MTFNEFVKRAFVVAGIVVFLLAFWHLRTIFMLAFLSAVIAVSLNIPAARLQQLGVRRDLSIVITLTGVILVLVLFLAWILPTVVVQMAVIAVEFPRAFEDMRLAYLDWYASQGRTMRTLLPKFGSMEMGQVLTDVGTVAPPIIADAGNMIVSGITNLIIVVVVSIFFLIEPRDYARGFILLIPENHRERALEVLVELRLTVTTWMTTLTFSITATIILVWFALGVVLGIPNALALGVIAGVATIIPIIGVIIPLVPIVIFTVSHNPALLPLAVPAYVIVQFIEASVLTPSVIKRQMSIPAAIILLFQLVAGMLLGFLGVLLAVPLLAMMITLVRELYIYDVMGMRGVTVDIEVEGDALHLVTLDAEGNRTDVIAEPDSLPPEDTTGWLRRVN